MVSKVTSTEFMNWIDNELREKNFSDSDASQRAGLSHSAIYEIRAGLRPGVKKCRALARFFGYPEEYVLRLAGHLPPAPETALSDVPRIQALAERVARLPAERQARVMDALLMLLEVQETVGQIREEPVQESGAE